MHLPQQSIPCCRSKRRRSRAAYLIRRASSERHGSTTSSLTSLCGDTSSSTHSLPDGNPEYCTGRINMLGNFIFQIESLARQIQGSTIRCGLGGCISGMGLHACLLVPPGPLSVPEERVTCCSISERGSPALKDLMAMRSLFRHRQYLPMTFGLCAVEHGRFVMNIRKSMLPYAHTYSPTARLRDTGFSSQPSHLDNLHQDVH
jgi:hypothetical protein